MQACRGDDSDGGATDTVDSVGYIEMEDVPDSTGRTLPNESDFLLANSTPLGYKSFRNSKGSWFIQAVVNIIWKYHKHMDLMKMLTRVNDYVAQKISKTNEMKTNRKKQIPSIVSRLRCDLYFSIEAAQRFGAYISQCNDK